MSMYSANKRATFKIHNFALKIAHICLLVIRMASTTIFIAFYKPSISPYIANRETILVLGTFWASFTIFG